jgi:hypothetical protein
VDMGNKKEPGAGHRVLRSGRGIALGRAFSPGRRSESFFSWQHLNVMSTSFLNCSRRSLIVFESDDHAEAFWRLGAAD